LTELLRKHRGVFANSDKEVGIANGYQFHMDLLDRNSVTSDKHCRVPYVLRYQVTAAVQSMERQGIIRKSLSPYCSGLVVVKKADGSLRIFVDYKDLNLKRADDGSQLPRRGAPESAPRIHVFHGSISLPRVSSAAGRQGVEGADVV
jgi:hypothetical protein